MHISEGELAQFFAVVLPHLDERQRRLFAGATAAMLGRGGDSAVARAARMSRNTVAVGRRESETPDADPGERVRRQGAGRPSVTASCPDLGDQLARLLHEGEPQAGAPLEWTFCSTYELADALRRQGSQISPGAVAQQLRAQGFQLNGPGRLASGHRRRDMEAQLGQIAALAGTFLARSLPAVEVTVRSRGASPDGSARRSAIASRPAGAALATETVRRWWLGTGRAQFPGCDQLLICSASFDAEEDGLGQWEHALTQLADQIDVELTVLYLPPVTRRWRNKETQLTELLTIQRGGCAVTYEARVDLLAATGAPAPASGQREDQPDLGRGRHGWCYRAAPMRGDNPAAPGTADAFTAATGSRRGTAEPASLAVPEQAARPAILASPTSPAGAVILGGQRDGAAERSGAPIPRVVKVAEMMAHDVARDISARHLQPGRRLPAIRSATDRYHVSSSSVRESLRILEMLGVISVKPGPHGGPVVRQVTTEDFALTSTFYHHILGVKVRDLLDARAALEPILVRFVAQRQPPVVMRRLRWHLTGSGEADVPGWHWLTRRSPTASFHRALLETGNPILDLTVHSLQECWLVTRKENPFPREVSHHDRDHARIAQAILKGEDSDAEWLMRRHMDYVSTFAWAHFADLMEKVIDWR